MTRSQENSLCQAIEKWIKKEAEEGFDFIVGYGMADCMTNAAKAVFNAAQDSQRHAISEGYLRESAGAGIAK